MRRSQRFISWLICVIVGIAIVPAQANPTPEPGPDAFLESTYAPEELGEPLALGNDGPTLNTESVLGIEAPETVGPALKSARSLNEPLDLAQSQAMYRCDGYGTLQRYNSVESVSRDQYAFDLFAPVTVGDGNGNINWLLDPYGDLGWKLWFSSLRWLGSSIEAARGGDDAAFRKVETIIRDWSADHGKDWSRNSDHMEANHHRMNTLICFREVVMQRHGGLLPVEYSWLTLLLDLHAQHNLGRWSGPNNHGSMENRVLLGYGCIARRSDLQAAALERIHRGFEIQVDEEGLSNEAAPGYALFNYNLFVSMRDLMTRCGHAPDHMNIKLELMGESLAHMVNATGRYWMYGNSNILRARASGSRFMRYAGSNGREGSRPRARIKAYANGPVFGRSHWGTSTTGFLDQPSWMLRTGTGKEHKAHRGDLLQFLYSARGREMVTDGGFAGVTTTKWHEWSQSALAHNTINISNFTNSGNPARLTRKEWSRDGKGDFTEASQPLANGGSRTRGVLVAADPDVTVVLDRTVVNDGKPHVIETLWNLPPDQTTVTRGRSVAESAVDGGSRTKMMLYYVPFWGATSPQRGELSHQRGFEGSTIRGFHFPRTFTPTPNSQVSFKRAGNRVATLSILVPTWKTAKSSFVTSRYADGATKLSITVGAKVVEIRITPGGYMSRVR